MYLCDMTEKEIVEELARQLTEKAKREGNPKLKPSSAVRNGSSLHKIIKTKEQADAFMKMLQSS
jgi:hypothetical protein